MHYFILFYFMISLMILPAGTIFGLPVKMVLFGAGLLSLCLQAIKLKAEIGVTKTVLNATYLILLLFILMLFVGVSYGNEYAIDEFKYLFVVLAVAFVLIVLSRRNIGGFLSAIFWGVILYAFAKAVLYVSIFLGLLNIGQVLDFYAAAFSDKFVHMPIALNVYRIQFPPDIIYAFLPVLYLAISRKYDVAFSMRKGAIIISAAGFIVFTAYSRYLFFVFAITFSIYMYYCFYRHKKTYISIMAFFIALCLFNSSELSGSTYFKERFSEHNIQGSDGIRIEQQNRLTDKWLQAPVLGNGAGSYLKSYVRTNVTPFSYEAQILGYLMKGGIVFLFPLLCFAFYFLRCIYINSGAGTSLLFGLLLLSGLTNPYLTSTATAILYAAFYLLGSAGNKKPITL